MSTGCDGCEAPAPPAPVVTALPAPTYTHTSVATDDARETVANAAKHVEALAHSPASATLGDVEGAALVAHVSGAPSALRALSNFVASTATEPKTFEGALARAEAFAALGRWSDADDELIRAKPLAAKGDLRVDELRVQIELARGHLDDALAFAMSLEARSATAAHAMILGAVRAARDDQAGADATLIDAETRIHAGDASLLLGEIYATRAALWERAGNLVEATSLYRAATDRAPMYVHAAVHLAALEPVGDAIARLTPLASNQADTSPDVTAALAVYREIQRDGAGQDAKASATSAYDELLRTAPIVANHAGWFFLRVLGDKTRAAGALKIVLEAGESSDAFELALAVGEGDAATPGAARCDLVKKARAFAFPSPALTYALDQLAGACL